MKFVVHVPKPKPRLDAKGTSAFRNHKKYSRKVKHPHKERE